MQTFLPYADFYQSANVLDMKRLGKQRVEAWQIYLSLTVPSYGWKNHPAVKMWRGYENALLLYGVVVCSVWRTYGYKDTMFDRFNPDFRHIEMPPWLGSWDFHSSHRRKLLEKNFEHYAPLFCDTKLLMQREAKYIWPV